MSKTIATLGITACLLLILPHLGRTQMSINNTAPTITTFNEMGSTSSLPANWKMSAAGEGQTAGWNSPNNVTATTQQAGPGNSPTTGGRYNWGSSASERSVGFMTSSGYASPNSIMAFYQNTSGGTINTLSVAFSIERFRLNTTTPTVSFFISSDGSTWQSISAGDVTLPTGSNSYAYTPPNTTRKIVNLTNLQITNNANFYLRWVFITGSSNSQGLALDDVSVMTSTAGKALHFDGTNDYADATMTATGLPQGAEQRTIEAWVKTTQTTIGNIVSWGTRANNQRVGFAVRNGKLAFIGELNDHLGVRLINDGEWHHVAITFNGSVLAFYVDGTLDRSTNASMNTVGQGLVIGTISRPSSGEFFNGIIDEVRIWNRALSAPEIQANMNIEIPTTSNGLLVNYHFNQGVAGENNSTVATLVDASGNNFNGTLTDFTLNGAISNWVVPGAPVTAPPTLTINDKSLNEGYSGPTTFTFTVSLSSPAPVGGVTFDISTANNTATAGTDYVAKSLTAQTIPAGNSTYTFDVIVNGDFTIEANETFLVNVTNVAGAILNDGQGQGTIVNDDVLTTYYPRTSSTDLSQASNWTDDATGAGGTSPADFSSPNQLFDLTTNAANPTVSGAWSISGGSNLQLNNTNPLVFTSSGSISIGSGSQADFNNRPVTLSSGSTGTAYIGTVAGTLIGATNVTVERFISSLNNRAYRLLAPSVNTATPIRQHWQENGSNTAGRGTHITGSTTGANGFDATQTGEGSLFMVDPVTFTYQYVANTNATNLNAKDGYLLYIRGDRTIDLSATGTPLPSNNTTLRATGSLLVGPQSFTGLYGGSEFNLVTNPYAAPIDWAGVRAASSNLTQFYTLWDPNIGSQGGYVTVSTTGVKSAPSSSATTHIQSGQAFFVQSTAGSTAAQVNINETHKTSSNNANVFRLGSQTEMLASSLYYTNASGIRVIADAVTSVYHNSYSVNIDEDDAAQLPNWDEDVAIVRNGSQLSIEGRPLIESTDTIPLLVARLQQRTYEWEFTASGFAHPNLQAVLVDNYLNSRQPINLNGTTLIAFTVTADAGSAATNRFFVVFQPLTALPVTMASIKAHQKGSQVQVEWSTQAEVNMKAYEVEKSTNGQRFITLGDVNAKGSSGVNNYTWIDANPNTGNNFYRVKGIARAGETYYSKVVRVNLNNGRNELVVYPNPMVDNTITLSFILPKGNYLTSIVNAAGQEVYRKSFTHAGGAASQAFNLEHNLSKGVYQVVVSGNSEKFVQTITKN